MSKKKIIAIVLFIFLGLFMFTFANPGEVKPVLKDPIKDVVEPKDNQDDDLNNDNNQDITTPVVNPVTNIPNIKVEPKRVIILYGDKYDVMTGVTLDSDEKLEINADITDTTKLNIGTYTITYTVSKNNNTKSSTRELVVLDPKGDEDNDGFTNEEEIKAEDPTDPFDPESHPETIDPIIRLLGDNPYKMAVGSRYVEAGVEIELDPHDNITRESDVKVESNLDVDSVGKYTLTYTITDRYGKSASVTRDVEVFKDENGNNIPDEDEEHYTVKFESEGRGKLEGTLIYENILTDLTFEAAGINVPTAVADNYYELKRWEPVEPTSETLVTSDVTYKAVFGPINDENQNGIADEEETYKLTIKYVYVDGKEASETYTKDVVYNMSYRVETPVIEKYTADKAVVEGVMPKEDVTVTVTYKATNDENGNNIPDEDEEHYTVKFESEGRGKLEGTLIYENILTDLTFEAAGINVPTAVADNYYELKRWEPVEPTSETLVTSDVTYKAVFGPINDENQNGIADEEETYKLTIKYVYVDGKEASETYTKDVVYNMSYRVETPVIEKYTADKAVVEGVMPKEDVTVTVTYKATTDENGNNIPDEDEEHYTVKFEAGEHGTLEGTLVYENILTDLTFEAAGIIVPSVTPNEGFKFVGWEPAEPTSETLVTSDITYVAKYDIDDSLVQVGIEVTLKPNTQLQFQVNSNVDIKNYLIVKRVFKDGHKEEITSYTTDFTTANVGEDITLTVTDGEFTNNEYTYDITYEEAYDTQFVVKFNLNKSFVRYVPKRGFLDWDYNSYTKETIKVDEDFLEITETYLENIEITNIKAEYIDGTTQILKTIDNEFSTGGLFDVKGSTVGIRWSKYKNDAFYNPVYRTSSINSTNIKYVYITYERTFSTNNKKNYTLKFENRNGEFVAISEETN